MNTQGLFQKGRILDGRFTILRKIGEGGMGEVYLATDLRTGTSVAIKLLKETLASENERQRFIQESRLASKIQHPNVVHVVDAFFDGSTPCFAMEYVEGHTLRDSFDQNMSWKITLPVIVDTLDAIYCAHQLSIIHRDLKPSNIFITSDSVVKVGDWGIATSINDPTGITKTGVILGTPEYLAPERIVHGTSLPQSDLYAIGCILHEALCGSPPFFGNLADIVNSQINQIPQLSSDFPHKVSAFIEKLLKKDPRERHESALAAKNELIEIMETTLKNANEQGFSTKKIRKKLLVHDATRQRKSIYPSTKSTKKTAHTSSSSNSAKRIWAILLILTLGILTIGGINSAGLSSIFSTTIEQNNLDQLISKVTFIDFQTIEFRYDASLKKKCTYSLKVDPISLETKREIPVSIRGTVDFSHPDTSSGRTNNIHISLPSPVYQNAMLTLGETKTTTFSLHAEPLFRKAFTVLSEIDGQETMTLAKKLSRLRGKKNKSKEMFEALLNKPGLTEDILDSYVTLIPRYMDCIDYSNNRFSDKVLILRPLRQLSSFIAQESHHRVFGLTSREMGITFRRRDYFPKLGDWTLMAYKELTVRRPDNKDHFPMLVYELDKLKQKGLFEKTAQTGAIFSLAVKDDHLLHPEDLLDHCEVVLKTETNFTMSETWPPEVAKLEIISQSYDKNCYYSVSVNGEKPIEIFRTWIFKKPFGSREVVSIRIPVEWLNKNENVINFVPLKIFEDKNEDLLQTMLSEIRIKVKYHQQSHSAQ